MEVDFEKCWFELKAHVASKRSHGADELKVKMADLEVGSRVPPATDIESRAAAQSDRPAVAAHA